MAVLLVGSATWAQSSPPPPSVGSPLPSSPTHIVPGLPAPPPALAAPRSAGLSSANEAAIDRRIDALAQELGIGSSEMGLWTAFAHAIRESVLGTAALAAQRAAAAGSMNAVDNLDDYARIARAYADATERLAGSFSRLYATLSPAQRRIADAMFRPSPTLAVRPVGGTRR